MSRWATSLFVLFLASLAATPPARAEGPVPCGVTLTVEAALQRLNETRAHGKTCRAAGQLSVGAPLVWSESLAAAALLQSREMALLNRMGHRDSADRNLGERLRAQGYRFVVASENVAVGYPSLEEVIEAWLDSEGHCENMMSGEVFEFGLACIDASETGAREERRYWTMVLGAPPQAR